MRHPLLESGNSNLRARVLALIKEGITFPRSSKIVFVCGGNDPDHMRPKFVSYCNGVDHPYLIFQPEYAISHAIAEDDGAFNLSEFERLIGDLSLAIVIFPEAPGSFAETGYFSGIDYLAKKSILLMDQQRVTNDSFLSIGPAKLISDKTRYHPVMHLDYNNPDFSGVLGRINARQGAQRSSGFPSGQYKDLSLLDKFLITACIFDILTIASRDDALYIMNGLFKGRAKKSEISSICAVMTGASILEVFGDADDYRATDVKRIGLQVRDGYREMRNALKTEISTLLMQAGRMEEEDEAAA
jgi:hypothetical protein